MKNKTRLLFTIPNFDTAGSQYVLLSIINKLDKNRFDIYVGVESSPELIPDIIADSHKVHLIYTGSFIKDIYRFAKVIRRLKIDIVHSWDYKSNFIEPISCRLAFKSFIYTKKNAAWSKGWFLKSVLSTHVVYDHPEMKSQFFDHFLLQNKVSLISHGVDLQKFKPLAPDNKQTNIFKLCCIGNIGENKNQLFILEQLKDLPETIHLYLYGNADAAYLSRIKTYIDNEGLQTRVHISPFVENDDLPQILNVMDLFVLASKREGFPVSILEALACGIPVLCSDSGGGTKHMFREDKGGYVFNLDKSQDFKNAVLKFFNNKVYFQQKKEEALSVAKEFDAREEVRAYELLYEQF